MRFHDLVLLCSFQHLTVIHRWGWTLALRADGSTTAMSPDRARTLHDHDPPRAAAMQYLATGELPGCVGWEPEPGAPSGEGQSASG